MNRNSFIFSFERAGPFRLLIKLALLGTPFLVWLGFPWCALWLSGETADLDHIIELQVKNDRPVLFGPGFTNPVAVYKLRSAERRGAEVAALGSSRVMQFRGSFFQPPSKFYNAGGAAANVYHFRHFLRSLSADRRPKVILLGIDQWQGNAAWQTDERLLRRSPFDQTPSANPLHLLQHNYGRVFSSFAHGEFTLRQLLCRRQVQDGPLQYGLHAVVYHSGYRNDGSRAYGKYCFEDRTLGRGAGRISFPKTLAALDRGDGFFAHGRQVASVRLAELAALADEAARQRIHLAAFLPPFAPTVYARIKSLGDRYGYMEPFAGALERLFRERGFTFVDCTDPATLGSDDSGFLDGFHGNEETYRRLTLLLAGQDALVRSYVANHIQRTQVANHIQR